MEDILLTGFSGTSSEVLVKRAAYRSLILPNDKVLDARILLAEIDRHSYKSFCKNMTEADSFFDKIHKAVESYSSTYCILPDDCVY